MSVPATPVPDITIDQAPRHEEISAEVERPELIIPQRTRGQRRAQAHAHAVLAVDSNSGFHYAFAAGISRKIHQLQLPPEPKHFREM